MLTLKTRQKIQEHSFVFRCEIIEEVVMTPVCVTVTDQQVDEVCEDRMVDATCFKRECKTGSEEVCIQ